MQVRISFERAAGRTHTGPESEARRDCSACPSALHSTADTRFMREEKNMRKCGGHGHQANTYSKRKPSLYLHPGSVLVSLDYVSLSVPDSAKQHIRTDARRCSVSSAATYHRPLLRSLRFAIGSDLVDGEEAFFHGTSLPGNLGDVAPDYDVPLQEASSVCAGAFYAT